MNLLLDTHVLIWFLNGDESLSDNSKSYIESNSCFISIASLWEIAVKISLDKLELHSSFTHFFEKIEENGFQLLPISFSDVLTVSKLEFHHRDPFDRILIAQSINNNLPIVSKDSIFKQYNTLVVW